MSDISYKSSGVDVAAADKLVATYSKLAKLTSTGLVLNGIGGFAGFLALPGGYKEPVLAACTDGVGTKLRLLIDAGQPETAGKDAAAMCLNDLATSGAQPLFMLDYLATGKLEPETASAVVSGFADYCRQAGCALLGGETAEMPGFYPQADFDVAGFAVGVVEKKEIIDGSRCQEGDAVIGIASSGLHSNGFSLFRLLLTKGLLEGDRVYPGLETTLLEAALAPTRLYLPLARDLAEAGVKAMAHITGGGLPGNAARTIPGSLDMIIASQNWRPSPIYEILNSTGVSRTELFATFNMGIGFTAVVDPDHVDAVIDLCRAGGADAWQIGRLVSGSGKVRIDG